VSLSAHDRRELRAIEQELTASDPHLAAMLSTFSRLTAGEAMPGPTRIPVGQQPTITLAAFGLSPHRPARRWSRRTSRRHPVVRASVLAMWVVITMALLGVAMLLGHSDNNQTCTRSLGMRCVTHTPASPQAGP
jgi:hypothetical protein